MLHYASVTQLGWVGAGCVLLALLLLFFSTQVSERTASSREKLLVEHKEEEVVEGKTLYAAQLTKTRMNSPSVFSCFH